MYLNLFQLTGLATVGWILLIFLPTWRFTRRLADSAFFPIYIAALYAFGIGALLTELGPGFIRDFGSPQGVARLLARKEIAWVAWIHILAFDQVVGLTIYRENMRRRYVPPFSHAESASKIIGATFFVSALIIVALSVALGARAFDTPATGRRGLLRLSARWAAASTVLGFASGMWMSANQGRAVGTSGNILPLHAAGFHALQALPVVALLFAWSALRVEASRRWIHLAGAAWAAACVAIWWQTAAGLPVTSPSSAMVVAAACLGLWALAAARALMAWLTPAPRVSHETA